MKRVVITGIGIVSCLGNNQKEVCDEDSIKLSTNPESSSMGVKKLGN